MGLALYRKYRPKGLESVVGQDHIVTTLKNALKTGKISHAYLFTGPRGVGKTSVARILAHEINGLDYSDDSMHLDIIEIDAASNRRIDEIRDLRDKVHIAPTSAKYKVYIIDEVHMLTREAFNALLKTLEEPPAHAVFILATTEAHKVPDTITSRAQRFSFKPITPEATLQHLRSLADQEGIAITDEALQALTAHGSGSFRDSINLLDQMVGDKKQIDVADVEQMLGIPQPSLVQSLLTSLASQDVVGIIDALTTAKEQGTQAGILAKVLGDTLRATLIAAKTAPDSTTLQLLRALAHIGQERDPFVGLELALFDAIAVAPSVVLAPAAAPPKKPAATAPAPVPAPKKEPETESKPAPAPKTAAVTAPPADDAFWQALLSATKKRYNTLYGVLRMAEPRLSEDQLVLVFGFAFHQKQMSQATNQQRVVEAASDILGRPIAVTAILEKGSKPKEVALDSTTEAPAKTEVSDQPSNKTSTKPLADVSSIFEGAELL